MNFRNTRENSADARIFHTEGTHNVKLWWKYFTIYVQLCFSPFARITSSYQPVSV